MKNLIDDIRAERAKYGPTMSDDECADLMNAVAWKNRDDGWGLNHKDSGTHGRRFDGVRIAHDILHHKPTNTLVDALTGAGAQSTPAWQVLGVNGNARRPWVAPVAPQGHTEPAPGPEPNPGPSPNPSPAPSCPSCNHAEVLSAISRLEARLDSLQSRLDGIANDANVGALAVLEVKNALRADIPFSINAGFLGRLGGNIPAPIKE